MKTNVNVSVNAADDLKAVLNKYCDIQQDKIEYQKNAASEDDDKLCFRICTSSGTRINIPSNILRDAMIAGAIIATSKIVIDILSLIPWFKK